MPTPTNSDTPLLLPPLLCGGIGHYLRIRNAAVTSVDWNLRFDKRFKATHRFLIADTHGPLDLTVPIAKPESSRCTWGDIRISDHGNWWDVHRIALESAYGRTPFFDYYIDPLLPMLTAGVVDRFPMLRDLSDSWDAWIRSKLLLPQAIECADNNNSQKSAEKVSSMSALETPVPPCQATMPESQDAFPPYWQVRADKLGFIPGLSILDLIFNLGPEAVIYLDHIR